jgi:gluconolactonase
VSDTVAIVAEGLSFPEGPVVMPDGSLIVMEMFAGAIRRIWGHARTEVVATPGGGPNGAQLGPDGHLYVCNNGGTDRVKRCSMDGAEGVGRIERINLGTGAVERLYDACDGRPLRAPNDLVIDGLGGIWFTDMGKTLANGVERSAIHYCRPDGSGIVTAYRGVGLSYNGIGLSPDGSVLYVAETHSGRLWRFSVIGPGELAPSPEGEVRPEWVANGHGGARFDSLAVTASGRVCVATMVTPGITSVTPDGATSLHPLPDRLVTNIAFGGKDFQTAYVTFAGRGAVAALRWAEPGLPLNFGYQGA